MVRLLQIQVNRWQGTSFFRDLISSNCAATRAGAPNAEGEAASRYKSQHQACVSLCASRSLCVSVTQRESSSHLCLSAAPASLTDEARNDSSALHSASLRLPHNTVPLLIIIILPAHRKHTQTQKLSVPYYPPSLSPSRSPFWLAEMIHRRGGPDMMQYSSSSSPSLSTSRPSAPRLKTAARKQDHSAGCPTNTFLLMLKFQIIPLNASLSATHTHTHTPSSYPPSLSQPFRLA